jgi:hypothetical protein
VGREGGVWASKGVGSGRTSSTLAGVGVLTMQCLRIFERFTWCN